MKRSILAVAVIALVVTSSIAIFLYQIPSVRGQSDLYGENASFSVPGVLQKELETNLNLSLIYTSDDFGGLLRNIWVEDDYMYLCEEYNKNVSVWDVYQPTSPVKLGRVNTSGYRGPLDIKKSGNYLYISAGEKLQIIDVSNPSSPSITGSVTASDGGWLHGICLDNGYVYAANFIGDALYIFDVSDPANPLQVSRLTDTRLNGIHDVVVEYPYAYVATHYGGSGGSGTSTEGSLVVINVSDPTNSSILSYVDTYELSHIAKKGKYVFTGSLCAYDVSDPYSPPSLVGSISGVGVGGYWIVISGKYAFVCSGDSWLGVVDISNPENMRVVDYFSTTDTVTNLRNIFIYGKYVFVLVEYIAPSTPSNNFLIFELEQGLELPTLTAGRTEFPAPLNYDFITSNEKGTAGGLATLDPSGNIVQDPKIHGADRHTDVIRELFIPVQIPDSNYGMYSAKNLSDTANTSVHFTFKVPDDYVSTLTAYVVVIAEGTGNIYYENSWQAAASGEAYNTSTGSSGFITHLLTVNQVTAISAQLAPISDLSQGGYVGIHFRRDATNPNDTIEAAVKLIGILLTYIAEQ